MEPLPVSQATHNDQRGPDLPHTLCFSLLPETRTMAALVKRGVETVRRRVMSGVFQVEGLCCTVERPRRIQNDRKAKAKKKGGSVFVVVPSFTVAFPLGTLVCERKVPDPSSLRCDKDFTKVNTQLRKTKSLN